MTRTSKFYHRSLAAIYGRNHSVRRTRVAVLRDPANSAGIGQFGAIQGAAPSFGEEVSPIGMHDAEQIERGITALVAADVIE